MAHPWSRAAKLLPKRVQRPLSPVRKWKILIGDKVEILGGKDQGEQGIVQAIDRQSNKVYVEGLNLHRRYIPPQGENKGGMHTSEAPLHYSKIALVDPKTGRPTRVRWDYDADGKKVRIAVQSNSVIPKPRVWERRDVAVRASYKPAAGDTKSTVAQQRTFSPSLLTFAEQILKEHGLLGKQQKSAPAAE